MFYFVDSGPKFTGSLSTNAEGIVRDHMSFRFLISCLFPEIFTIKVGSCVKSTKILAGVKDFRGGPTNFWTCIKKKTHMLITVQSFAAFGLRSLEILCLIKKTSRLKQKAFGTNVPGGLKSSMVVVGAINSL